MQILTSFFYFILLQVFVCSSLANLYEKVGNDWQLVYTGVPVLLHDKGVARSRATPRVQFVLAERGSCFAFWQDTIDNLSNFKVAGPTFHTMCFSTGKCLKFYNYKEIIIYVWLSTSAALTLMRHFFKYFNPNILQQHFSFIFLNKIISNLNFIWIFIVFISFRSQTSHWLQLWLQSSSTRSMAMHWASYQRSREHSS